MTVMEQKLNSNLAHETNKFQMINLNNNNNIHSSDTNHNAQIISNEKIFNNYSRKNSATGSNGIPASNLSLSSTSSTGSASKYNDSKFKKFSNNSFKLHDSTPPQTSRRASGNSITIRVTNETNDHVEDESLNKVLNEIDSFDKQDDELEDRAYGDRDRDRDEAEDTTSESTSNEHISNLINKKKLKDRRKLVRSAAQQQHHLLYQESEDQIEEELKSKYNSLEEQLDEQSQFPNLSMNSAFDELFAAAETGNSSISAIVEAKIAAATHVTHEQADYDIESQFLRSKNSFSNRSRNNSFRANSNKKFGQSVDESKFINNQLNSNSSNNESTNTINKGSNKNNHALNVETNLGAPQLLTRSCSCKRPGSFKRMKAKNAGIATAGGGVSPSRIHQQQSSNQKINTSGPLTNGSNTNNANIGRRGTQCSIVLPESLDNSSKLAGSLPFESNQFYDEDAEVYRVRQFNITQKGSVINRGDSFKRSFKRSNNSLSSKKEVSSNYYEGNTLNLPDFSDGFNKSSASSNCGLNDTTTNNDCTSNSNESYGNNMHLNEINATSMSNTSDKEKEKRVEPVNNFLVYVIGSSGVGKNALIKQFKTSEYRGTYDIDTQGNLNIYQSINYQIILV